MLQLRVDLDDTERLLFHLPQSRKIYFLVTIIGELLHDWMVLPDCALDASVLQHKVLDVVAEPVVDYLRRFAPVVVLCCVAAVRQSYHWEGMVGVLPRIPNLHLVSVLEAQRLVIPV